MIIHCPLCTRLVLLTGRNLAWHAVGKEECPYKVLEDFVDNAPTNPEV